MIKLTYLDSVFMRIDTDRSTLMELSERFTFFTKGYKFMPAYKKGFWDGKIRLVDIKTSKIYVGLFKEIYEYCKDAGYPITVDPLLKSFLISKEVDTDEFIESLDLPEDRTPRIYQHETLALVSKFRRKLILSATGSGKSLSIYLVIRYILDLNPEAKIMMIVPTVNLVKQMISDFEEYSAINGWPVQENVYGVYTGQEKFMNKSVMISTWQSAAGFPKDRFALYDAVICDEVHLAPGKSIRTIIDGTINAIYRVGFTGTLDESETNEMTLVGMFGPVSLVAASAELMDDGHLARLSIQALVLKYPDHVRKDIAPRTYQEEIEYITTDATRRNFVVKLAGNLTGNTLILATKIEQCRELYDKISSLHATKKVFLITGSVIDGPDLGVKPKDYRETVRKYVNDNDDCILIASYGVMSTGTNIPRLNNAIFASPYKSKVKVLQSVGRILRKAVDKDSAVLYDLVDDLSWKKRQNHTMKHFMHRMRLYNEEGFDIQMKEISLT